LLDTYTLCASGASYTDAPERVVRGLARHAIPAVLLARLAVDTRFQKQGLGAALLRDATLKAMQVAGIVGVRAIVASAKDDAALQWYSHFGFKSSPTIPMLLFLLLKDVRLHFSH